MNKRVIGGILTGAVIASSVACAIFDYKTTVYQCGKCKTIHKPSVKAWVCGMHTFGKRMLKCPKCGETSWNDRFVVADESDFI